MTTMIPLPFNWTPARVAESLEYLPNGWERNQFFLKSEVDSSDHKHDNLFGTPCQGYEALKPQIPLGSAAFFVCIELEAK